MEEIINYIFIPLSCGLTLFAIIAFFLRKKSHKLPQLNTQNDISDLLYRILFCTLLAVALILRLYHLKTNPAGINCDEAGTAYDAYCLGEYGTDRFGYPFPVYFVNYGVGQNALYTYLLIPFIKILGTSATIYRIPAVIGGMMTLFFGMKLSKDTFDKKLSLIVGGLITVCPFFIMSSRRCLECLILLGFSVMSIYLLTYAVKKQKKRYFILSGISFGLCLYCYSLSWIILPIYLLLMVIYLFRRKKINFTKLLSFSVPLFLLALPLMTFVYINTFEKDSIVTSFFSIINLPTYRVGEISFKNITNIINVLPTLFVQDDRRFTSFLDYGTLYLFSIPFVMTGFCITSIRYIKSLRKKEYEINIFIYTFFLASLLILLFVEDANQYRSNCIYFCFVYFLAVGIRFICEQLFHKRVLYGILGAMYAINFLAFARFYYTPKVQEKYPIIWFDFDYTAEIYEYLHQNNITTDVYFDEYNVTTYCVAMLEYKVSPKDYMSAGNDINGNYCKYKNLFFYLPATYNLVPDSIYIVLRYNRLYQKYDSILRGFGMDCMDYGYYSIYFPMVVSEE